MFAVSLCCFTSFRLFIENDKVFINLLKIQPMKNATISLYLLSYRTKTKYFHQTNAEQFDVVQFTIPINQFKKKDILASVEVSSAHCWHQKTINFYKFTKFTHITVGVLSSLVGIGIVISFSLLAVNIYIYKQKDSRKIQKYKIRKEEQAQTQDKIVYTEVDEYRQECSTMLT
ncbi:Hypothetical_protein [Hexamita inflata]|uniref:Hypothetical_protein n=1 Tax=Hexamita inflata TaxID=28002 RepID=A0AA86U2P7_9EUKA|nr:Hypothetical protein HINF_LOCUS3061 [Hexamita inflata]CAI9928888.1 Hypothetical protein HINF_LOCUS16533 [Hexamita inflata]CAI9942874.1 Hypothetical protein HINF_LOCUS30519 [Hexamita inflata]